MATQGTRAALYARFSTDQQNERSTEDQIQLCRAHALREGLEVVATFEDKAKSGASIFGRDGLISLMAKAREKAFDVLIVEHPDRLSRSMRDLADIHQKFTFLGIEIRAVHSGTMDTAMIGLFGLVGQMQREDGAKKVRRGMAGVIRDGRHAGGLPYGYRVVAGKPGELEIEPAQAEAIRRIFDEYLAGNNPREIARVQSGCERSRRIDVACFTQKWMANSHSTYPSTIRKRRLSVVTRWSLVLPPPSHPAKIFTGDFINLAV
jgi:site-specific DNA recombinase